MCLLFLISEGEDDVTEENDAVDNGQTTLGQSQFTGIGFECWMNEIIIPFLNDESTGGNEQCTSDQAEENIDALVDWGGQQIACEQREKIKHKNYQIIV